MQVLLGKRKNKFYNRRYFVITNKRFFYYYTDKDYKENKEPLGYFELKYIYNLENLPDFTYGGRKNLFTITVSQWNKKDEVRPGRSYFLSGDTKEKMMDWVATINFLRVKATYDEFSSQFGLINLPLAHEIIDNQKTKFKRKFVPVNGLAQQYKVKSSSSYYNSIARKSVMPRMTSNTDKLRQSDVRRMSYLPSLTEHMV